jgi:hemolysin III
VQEANATPLRIGFNKDPWSWLTHFGGFIAAIVGAVFLMVQTTDVPLKQATMALYGATLVLMFATSSTYHFLDLGVEGNRWLRRADHCAIFLLIAGSSLPAAVHLLDGGWRIVTITTLGVMATAGIIFKLLWLEAPRWVTISIYIGMAWGALVPGFRMFPQLDAESLTWLFGGGAAYTFGALIYATKRPDPFPGVFGFHEVWHVFVLVGAACHYFFALQFCDAPCVPF